MYEKKIGSAATIAKMKRSVTIGMLRMSRNSAATNAATTAPTAANVVFIQATARYSSGRSRMWAFRRLSSSSGSLPVRAWTNFPNMRHATCAFGGRLTLTGLAPFGSFTMWAPLSVSSPGRNRFVFVSVPRVSSLSNAELPNRLASRLHGLHDGVVLPAHLLSDPLRGVLRVLVVLHDDLRDLSEVDHVLLQHVVDNIDAALELRLHLLVSHVLHLHDLIEQERVPLVDEGVRRGVPLVDRVRDEFVRLRLKPDELDDLLHPSHDRVSDPGVGLDDDEVQGGQQDARRVDRRVLQAVHHRLDGVRVHRGHRRVARRHGLEHRVRLLAADLSDDDVVRPLPQRGSDEVVHVDLAARLAVGAPLANPGPRRPGDPVLMGQVDLPGVLDGHDLRARSDEEGGAVQGRGLPARGPAADHHRLAILDGDPEVRDHLRARGAELHEFDRREGFLLVPPDREGRPAGRDLLAVCRLDTVAFHRGPVEDRVRDGDLLAASLAEHDRERVQGVLVIEDDVRLERFELLVEDEQGDARAVAGHVFDSQVIHEDVDRAVSDEVADDVVDDLVLRGRGEAQAARLNERVDCLLEVLLLVLLRHLVPFVFERAVQGVLDHVEELFLLRVELRFPDLVDVLGAIVVIDDARVGERLSDRDDLDFLQGVAREIRDVREVGAARAGPLGLLLNRAPRHEDLFLFRHLGSP